ncbi:eukaryotic translation initiation factor 3 subunit D [Diabrotica virgifera virgifera]|uniref:Eukaryotic translation initiation factor 3 subunit D n=1 Tax=Diabrotica virgifera virgifera TaxID=50390 RepID=A0A6P7GI26_DIAVI|nr:eukaryotic translation initiation factor 3 subunit D [Diabrotica virgifera virgifera]
MTMTDYSSGGEAPHFVAPVIQDNQAGWGPCEVPDQFKDMPYQPFSKGDRLGKISDWTGAAFQDKKYANKYASQFGSGSQYAYYHDEDESTFHLVDTTRVQKPPYQRGRFRANQRNMRGRGGRANVQGGGMQALGKGVKTRDTYKRSQVKRWGQGRPQIKIRDASVTVRPDWSTIEEMDFPRLGKLSLPGIKDGDDVLCCGELEYYDKSYDRVNVKNEKALQSVNRIFHTVTTTDDPVIRKLTKTEGNVYATDAILATIMCCTRSNYSWDIVIEKIGDKLFFDKRDNTEFDLLTVNETSVEPPQDDGNSLNSPRNLALEATFINHNFSQQVLKIGANEPRYKFDDPNPFISEEEEGEIASVAYRYRKWDLGGGITLVARCEHDAVVQSPNGELQFLTIKALNEWDSKLANGVEWRQKLDTQRGAVLANELRNNACKLAKWTVQALLAGSDQIKFGYVSRAHVRDNSKHVILGTQQYKPHEFATQINLNMDNAWGILRCIVDIVMKQKDGKYLIMKDPNKPMIRLYDIPDNTFESDGETESDDDVPESSTAFPLYSYSSSSKR